MRSLVRGLTMLTLIGIAPAFGETLAEVAAREASRREQAVKKAPSYSQDALGQTEKIGTYSAMSGPAVEPVGTRERLPLNALRANHPDSEATVSGGQTEAAWRHRAALLHARIRAHAAEVKKWEGASGGMSERKLACENPPNCWHPGGASASPRQSLRRARSQLAAAQQGMSELEDAARRASVPPGWLRER